MNAADFTIYDMIARNSRLHPKGVAMVHGESRTTFSDYRNQCDRCAAGLVRDGIKRGDRIAVLAGNSSDFMILCGAAARIGAVAVLVNTRLNAEEIAYILEDATPRALVSGNEYRTVAEEASGKAASVKRRYLFNLDTPEGLWTPFTSLSIEGKGRPAEAVTGETPFLIIHTAAVGGRPKGTILSQGNLVAGGLQIAQLLGLGRGDCHIGILPLFHIGGMLMTIAAMHQGGKTVMVERFDPATVLRLIEKERGTFAVTFPPMLGSLLDAQEKASFDTSSLRIICGVDSPETCERFLSMNPHAAFYSLYGQTEAMPISGGDYRERPGSIGRPAILTHLAVFDDLDREAPTGTTGEICVRSASAFQGYWNLEDETAYTFRNGWHHTGDLGRLDEAGFLWYGGRKPEKELIKPGGENVYPAEVEKVILDHGAIEEVCVIGVPDAEWGEAVKAVCVVRKGCTVAAEELISFVASRIARYKKPKHVVFVESLPKTATGAIDREETKKAHTT
jgi:acyl-CoA synthetase (AMP-forming)/AMP-acid ligase II